MDSPLASSESTPRLVLLRDVSPGPRIANGVCRWAYTWFCQGCPVCARTKSSGVMLWRLNGHSVVITSALVPPFPPRPLRVVLALGLCWLPWSRCVSGRTKARTQNEQNEWLLGVTTLLRYSRQQTPHTLSSLDLRLEARAMYEPWRARVDMLGGGGRQVRYGAGR